MDNTFNLLKALCESLGYEVGEAPEFKLKKKPKQPRTKEVTYSDEFNLAWYHYPRRAGGNPKPKAYQQWCARINQFEDGSDDLIEAMIDGAKRYKAFCSATKKSGTEYVMQACKFFGKDMYYLEEWEIPKETTRLKLPFNDDELEGFARKHGLSTPPLRATYADYRKLLLSEIERRG